MKYLGIEISEDGKTQWRDNNGSIERRALYASNKWEPVADLTATPRTAEELEKYCIDGNFGYIPPTTQCTLIKKYQKLTGKKAAETFCRTHNGAREMVSSRLARVANQIARDGQAGTGTLTRRLPGGVRVGDLI